MRILHPVNSIKNFLFVLLKMIEAILAFFSGGSLASAFILPGLIFHPSSSAILLFIAYSLIVIWSQLFTIIVTINNTLTAYHRFIQNRKDSIFESHLITKYLPHFDSKAITTIGIPWIDNVIQREHHHRRILVCSVEPKVIGKIDGQLSTYHAQITTGINYVFVADTPEEINELHRFYLCHELGHSSGLAAIVSRIMIYTIVPQLIIFPIVLFNIRWDSMISVILLLLMVMFSIFRLRRMIVKQIVWGRLTQELIADIMAIKLATKEQLQAIRRYLTRKGALPIDSSMSEAENKARTTLFLTLLNYLDETSDKQKLFDQENSKIQFYDLPSQVVDVTDIALAYVNLSIVLMLGVFRHHSTLVSASLQIGGFIFLPIVLVFFLIIVQNKLDSAAAREINFRSDLGSGASPFWSKILRKLHPINLLSIRNKLLKAELNRGKLEIHANNFVDRVTATFIHT